MTSFRSRKVKIKLKIAKSFQKILLASLTIIIYLPLNDSYCKVRLESHSCLMDNMLFLGHQKNCVWGSSSPGNSLSASPRNSLWLRTCWHMICYTLQRPHLIICFCPNFCKAFHTRFSRGCMHNIRYD